MDRGGPIAHGDMAGLEDGGDLDREGLEASVALPQTGTVALALQLARAVEHAAVRARPAVFSKACLDIRVDGSLIVEVRFGGNRRNMGRSIDEKHPRPIGRGCQV